MPMLTPGAAAQQLLDLGIALEAPERLGSSITARSGTGSPRARARPPTTSSAMSTRAPWPAPRNFGHPQRAVGDLDDGGQAAALEQGGDVAEGGEGWGGAAGGVVTRDGRWRWGVERRGVEAVGRGAVVRLRVFGGASAVRRVVERREPRWGSPRPLAYRRTPYRSTSYRQRRKRVIAPRRSAPRPTANAVRRPRVTAMPAHAHPPAALRHRIAIHRAIPATVIPAGVASS
jgi:hypothetical protein